MNELTQLHCSVITSTTPRLDERDVSQYLAKLPGWQVYEKEGEPRL